MFNFHGLATDIDPKADNCCAWLRSNVFDNYEVIDFGDKKNPFYGFCGSDKAWGKGSKFGKKEPELCCSGSMEKFSKKKFHECDFKYRGNGPAFTDVLDFIRDEQLWLREFTKAWHHATENNDQSKLKWLDETEGPK